MARRATSSVRLSSPYQPQKNGALAVKVDFTPDTAAVKALARLGLTFRVKDTFGKVEYNGRGDIETYNDRKAAGFIGRYNTTAEAMFHYYVKPTSNG